MKVLQSGDGSREGTEGVLWEGADSGTLQPEAQCTQDKGSALAGIRIIHKPSNSLLDLTFQFGPTCTAHSGPAAAPLPEHVYSFLTVLLHCHLLNLKSIWLMYLSMYCGGQKRNSPDFVDSP